MALRPSTVETATAEVFQDVLSGSSDGVLAIGLNETATAELLHSLDGMEDPPFVRLLTYESVLKWIREDFVTASVAAELVATNTLSAQMAEGPFENVLLVTDESVTAIISTKDDVVGLSTENPELVEGTRAYWEGLYKESGSFPLRTPAYSAVGDSLVAEFGPELVDDFRSMLDALESTRGQNPDEVVIALLVAAKHEKLLYDISRWGENIGIASKATFSREKMRLEEAGLIATEKVPVDVGRPRLRLLLGDERLRTEAAEEFVSVVRDELPAGVSP
ncbi:transcriptional regulator TbsP [Halococcus hamelinensis]|uniref:Transcriptional regulator n=1 Tax=Halococcus hamelinensis 100A6 TaxID=1132509 RepID=M0LY38_9EURY|nr:DUF5821 family protein [Halococcus hamelinensis]EMA38078.1 hypothetical protein C447_11595 [Halococcus hamelinensis 100A6]